MTTVFDRYLLKRYLHSFVILFVTTFGLFVVIDGFTNVDEFQRGNESAMELLGAMGSYYLYQSAVFFELVGPILSVASVIIVFAVLLKQSELFPLLAAGVPTYRLVIPFVFGSLLISASLAANQEFIIPRIADQILSPRADAGEKSQHIEPIYDYDSHLLIDGKELFRKTRKIHNAKFVLRAHEIAKRLTTLKASEAVYHSGTQSRPAGWLLRNVRPKYGEIALALEGMKTIRPVEGEPSSLYVVTDIGFDQLSNRSRGYQYISTPELIRRIKNPSTGFVSVRAQVINLHARLTRPFASLAVVLVAVPLIVRKEGSGLIANIAVCAAALGLLYGVGEAFHYLGKVNLIPPDLALWAPVIIGGTLGAWLSKSIQT